MKKKIENMTVAWIAFLIEIVIAIPTHALYEDFPTDILIVLPHCLVMVVILLHNRQYRVPMIVGYILRILTMLFDCYTLSLSDMNPDTHGYYGDAVHWIVSQKTRYGGMYSRILGMLFRQVGASRLLAEYLNVVLGMTTLWLFYKCLVLVSVDKTIVKRSIWILAVFPYSIYSSSVTYRETFIATFVAASLYFALRWYLNRKWICVFMCGVCLMFAATFHAGVIVMGLGYAILFILYSHKTGKLMVNRRTIATLCLVIVAFILIVYIFPEIFFGKLNNMTEEKIVKQYNYSSGGSAYLTWVNAGSLRDTMIYSPLKFIYFLISPMPYEWRGLQDISAFLIDSIWYAGSIFLTVKNYKKSSFRRFIFAVGIGWLATAFVFGFGTWTAGTALRHRNKILEPLLLLTALALTRNGTKGKIKTETAVG